MSRSVEMRYNPYSQSIEVIDSAQSMENLVSQMRLELNHLSNAVREERDHIINII